VITTFADEFKLMGDSILGHRAFYRPLVMAASLLVEFAKDEVENWAEMNRLKSPRSERNDNQRVGSRAGANSIEPSLAHHSCCSVEM